MSHSFHFSAVSERLFILQQLQAASQEYCRSTGICKDAHPYGHDSWNEYHGTIKPLVSGIMIEVAAKVRIFQDSLVDQIPRFVFDRADKYSLEDIPLGKVHAGNFNLSVRESCNKIIHATRVELGWINRNVRKPSGYTYWSGNVDLFGEQAKKKWHLELNSTAWCVSIDTYLDHVLSNAASDGVHVA